jgi:hypothetical protein
MENVNIDTYETDPKNERYGLPKQYKIKMRSGISTEATLQKSVHWTRIIHVAEDCLEDDINGTPQLEAVLNRLQDLELIAGGSAEMFWEGAFYGLNFKLSPDARLEPDMETKMKNEMEKFVHKVQRYIRTVGVDVQTLAPTVVDPSNHVSMLVDLIACAKGIPKRILLGSERGELASSQDEKAWMDNVDGRRREHCEPVILRPFINRLITVGVLPEPKEKYAVDWPDLMAPGEKDIAEVGEVRSRALANYVNAIGAETYVPREFFLKKMLGLKKEEIDQIALMQEGQLSDKQKQEAL